MTLVRCPTHRIPYNDENPRGCPACAREREGGGQASIMQELARATRKSEQAAPDAKAGQQMSSATAPGPPVTTQPKPPTIRGNRLEELLWQAGRPRTILGGVVVIVLLIVIMAVLGGPQFIADPHPVPYGGSVLPLPIEPNTPISNVFAVLGTRTPTSHPAAPSLARYSYGTDLVIDALNGQVYAVTFSVPNRSWQGLRVGVSPQNAEGALALLGVPEDRGIKGGSSLRQKDGYAVYPSREEVPIRTLVAAVRPPNGCFDVHVELSPRILGALIEGDNRLVVIGPENEAGEWVVTRIQVVSRAVAGPDDAEVACA